MKFNLINPSDAYTFEADDLMIAAVVASLLGNGKYPADAMGADRSPDNNVPPFLFGGHDEWFTAKFGKSYEAIATHCLEQRGDALARALESVALTNGRRTSLNDIGSRARQYAQAIRAAAQADTPTA